jgi:SAM-dependent methyltransferase
MAQTVDPTAFKERERASWASAAPGWKKHDTTLTAFGEPVSQTMIEHADIGPGKRILDVACGTGEPALQIATAVRPSGSVLATDFAEPLLAFARVKAEERGLANVEFRCVDAEALDLPSESFDAATIRWGIMFMPHPVGALSRVRKALRPGGKLVVATWAPPDKNPLISVPLGVLRKHVELPTPPPDAPGVFAFANPERLNSTIQAAGFHEVLVESFDFAITVFESGADAWTFTREIAPPIAQLYDGQLEDVRKEIDAEVVAALSRFRRGDALSLPAASWIALAAKA